jgi:DNA-binding transcriptional LysR family regulator
MSDLADLEVFARIVTAGSLSDAGRDLNLSPAVISKRLKRLEERLGARLLQRTTRKVALTEAGQGYYERVVAILAAVEEASSFVHGGSGEARGTLRVAAPTSFGRLHIAPHLPKFLEQNQGLSLDLQLSDEFVDLVGDGFDVAVRIADLGDSSLVAKRLAPNVRVLCAAPAYLSRRGTPKSIADLQRHTLLTNTSNDPWKLEGPDGTATVKVAGPLRTNSSEVVREAVLAGLGIALRSTWDVGPDLRAGRLKVVLPGIGASRRVAIHAVYPTKRFLPGKVRAFIDYLSDIYGSQPYWDRGLDLPPEAVA